jgi:hypothetical protein
MPNENKANDKDYSQSELSLQFTFGRNCGISLDEAHSLFLPAGSITGKWKTY